MKKNKVIISMMIVAISFFINDTAKAVVTLDGNWSSFGSDNACGTGSYGYTACYLPKYEFRVTLVNKNGQRVTGTKSVEYGYSTNGKTNLVTYSEAQKNNFVNSNSFKYKYSDEYNDYLPISSHVYYQVNMVDNPSKYVLQTTKLDRPEKYKEFTDSFIGGIHSKAKRYGIDPGTSGNYTFLTMFLYHCGYLNKAESGGQYYNIDDEVILNAYVDGKAEDIAKNDYYMLIEPLYTIFYNETQYGKLTYKYGTASEIGQLLYNNTNSEEKIANMKSGYLAGLSLIFTYNAGTNLYTQPGEATKEFRVSNPLKTIDLNDIQKYNTNNPTSPLNIRTNRRGKWAELANTNYGYGVSVLRLKNGIKPQKEDNKTYEMILNQCGKEVSKDANDGIISFSAPITDQMPETNLFFEYDENKFTKNSNANSTVYCYDEFEYDFSKTLEKLNSNNKRAFQKGDSVIIEQGKLTVTRYCYIKDWTKYTKTTQKADFVENFNMYKKNISLNLFGATIKMEPTDASTEIKYEYVKQPKNNPLIPNQYVGDGIIKVTKEIDFSYTKNSSNYIITVSPATTTNYQASVDLSNISYGYSTNLINELEKNDISYSKTIYQTDIAINKNYHLSLTHEDSNGNANDKICSVVSKVDGGTTDKLSDIKFRTIALDNPFPARDATSRMPGSNWLGTNNYIRGYITYNRGVTGEEVYDKEPIYTIKLTPSTMIKIREYNKKHNYGDIELKCSGENNTECMSEFLRDTSIFKSDSVTGSCMITSNTYQDITRGITEEQFQQKLSTGIHDGVHNTFEQEGTYDSKYDLNNDKRVNKNDALIFTYAEKTTPYYTCADKTFENSGYLGRSEE